MSGIPSTTPLLQSSRATSTSTQETLSPPPAPLRNEELRSILLNLKAGNPVKQELLDRFLSESPLKEHPLSLEKTTEQGDLLVALTHLLRGSLDDKHSTFKNPSNPSNSYRTQAEGRLGNPDQIAKFKTALKLKLEAFQTKNLKTIGGAVLVTGAVVDIINPLHWIGFLKDAMVGHQKNALGNDIATASFYNAGLRANFIGKKVDQALLDIQKTEEQIDLIDTLLRGTSDAKENAAEALKHLSEDVANHPRLVEAGVLAALLIDRTAPDKAKEYATRALCNLSKNPANHKSLVDAGAHERLAALLIDKMATDEAKRIAAGALLNLSTNKATHQSLNAGARTQLDTFLETATDRARKYAARVLAELGKS